MTEIERFAGPDVNKMLVGNKCDMVSKKVVDYSTAKVSTNPLANSIHLFKIVRTNVVCIFLFRHVLTCS